MYKHPASYISQIIDRLIEKVFDQLNTFKSAMEYANEVVVEAIQNKAILLFLCGELVFSARCSLVSSDQRLHELYILDNNRCMHFTGEGIAQLIDERLKKMQQNEQYIRRYLR